MKKPVLSTRCKTLLVENGFNQVYHIDKSYNSIKKEIKHSYKVKNAPFTCFDKDVDAYVVDDYNECFIIFKEEDILWYIKLSKDICKITKSSF